MPTRVLILADDDHSAVLWQSMFEAGGYETILVLPETTDWKSVESELPNLIYVDVVPGQRSVEIIKQIRNDKALNLIPIIFFTANKDWVQSAKELVRMQSSHIP